MRLRRVAATAAAWKLGTIGALAPANAGASVLPVDAPVDDRTWVNGPFATAGLNDRVGAIFVGGQLICTGWMYSSTKIATAGHCVYDRAPGGGYISTFNQFVFKRGYNIDAVGNPSFMSSC